MNTILFDLDGTLLPMDQEKFTKTYFKALAGYMAPYGFEPKALADSIWTCTKKAMCGNGTRSNHDTFWNSYAELYGDEAVKYKAHFDTFYETQFSLTKAETSPTPFAAKSVKLLKSKGYRLVLATNPIFPKAATYARAGWAGLDTDDFELITTYENSSFCKPNPKYYAEILQKIDAQPQDCMMIGNDVDEDMCAAELGMETALLTDCLINRSGRDISHYRQFDFPALYRYFETLPEV